MSVSQCYGSVGFQSPAVSAPSGTLASADVVRDLYRAGRIGLSALVMSVCKVSDHGHALRAGGVDVPTLLAAGVDLRKAEIAFNRATGDGSRARAQRASMVAAPSTVELALIAAETDERAKAALAKVASARKAKRNADKAGKAGKVYSGAELAALAASYGVAVAVRA